MWGDPERWQQLYADNRDRPQPTFDSLREAGKIYPGWRFIVRQPTRFIELDERVAAALDTTSDAAGTQLGELLALTPSWLRRSYHVSASSTGERSPCSRRTTGGPSSG